MQGKRTFQKNMKEKLLKLLLCLFPFIFFAMIIGGIAFQHIQLYRTLKTLNAIQPQHISAFRIYPKVIHPVGSPVDFTGSVPIVEDFSHAISDFRHSSLGYHSVASDAHSWSMEIIIRGRHRLHISCYIPWKGDFVFGEVTKISENNTKWNYGAFKSRQLFQWYQKYSHRWLEPENSAQ